MRRSVVRAGRAACSAAATGVAMLTAVALAGCSGSAAPAATASAGRPASPGPAASGAPAGPVSVPVTGSRALAQGIATHLLASLVFPAGAAQMAGPVPAALQHQGEGPVVASQAANVHQVYKIPERMAVVFSYLKAHVPAGLGSIGSGQTTEHGSVESDEITAQQTAVPVGIYLAAMAETIVAGPGGSSLVLADAEVIWHPARSAAEYLIASHFSAVQITATMTSGSKATVSKTLTARTAIAQIVDLLDGLQAAPGVPPGNLLPPATYQLRFVPAAAGQPAVHVSDGGVLTDAVTVGGVNQPALWDPPNALATLVDALAGITVP